jgi:hypothetical protein
MPIDSYPNQLEPTQDAAVWRFMDLYKFRDLLASEELYFRRADLFSDETEGLPPEQYAMRVLGLNPYDLNDRAQLNNHLGFLAQNRESYYISCWHLHRGETLDMWAEYGEQGVAVCSRYELLKATLATLLDKASLGLVRYGTEHLKSTFNTLEFITTKQLKYADDREVRAWLTVYHPFEGGNRHIDLDNSVRPRPLAVNPRHPWIPDCKRRRIDLRALVTGIVISPWTEADAVEEIKIWAGSKGFDAPERSVLTSGQTPTLDEFRAIRHLAGSRAPELRKPEESPVSEEQLEEFSRVFSRLNPALLRLNYRNYWEACRLSAGRLPSVAHAQYLEATLRVLEAQRLRGMDIWSA